MEVCTVQSGTLTSSLTSPNPAPSYSRGSPLTFFLEPKVHEQSSPMCRHPPRSRSLIFQHYKCEASSHSAEQRCKEMLDVHKRIRATLSSPTWDLLRQEASERRFIHLETSSHVFSVTCGVYRSPGDLQNSAWVQPLVSPYSSSFMP